MIRIGCPVVSHDGRRVSAQFFFQNRSYEWWYESEDLPVFAPNLTDAFLPGAYLASLWTGSNLQVEGPCSEELVGQLEGPVTDVWKRWFPDRVRPIVMEVLEKRALTHATANQVGCFFSGGVDSLYTAVTQSAPGGALDSITHLVTVHGFDIPIQENQFFEKVAEANRRAAEKLGMRFVRVRTNIREWSDRFCPWEFFHGAAMAGVGHWLSGALRMMWIPSGTGTQERWGTHQDLDPHWGTHLMSFRHDVIGVQRLQKIKRIADDPSALSSLRVCWENKDSLYNCSSCEKCLRTMVCLHTLGLTHHASVFQWNHLVRSLLRLRIPAHLRHHWKNIEKNLELVPGNSRLLWAVRWALGRSAVAGRLRGEHV